MKAITLPEFGGPDALVLADVDTPTPRAGEVLVRVAAAGVNRADLLQRQGHYAAAGRRVGGPRARGERCRRGRSARASTAGRSATRCARCSPVAGTPSRCGCPPGSCCPCRRGCRWSTRRRCPRSSARCGPTSSSSPTSSPARRCSCTAGRPASARWRSSWPARWGRTSSSPRGPRPSSRPVGELGAEVLVNYREEDFVERVAEATDGHGADVILDIVGAKYLSRNVAALATSGRLVIIGMQGGTRGELDIAALLAQARGRHRDVAAGAARRPRRRPSWRRCASTSGRSSQPGGCSRSCTRGIPWRDAAAAHRELEAERPRRQDPAHHLSPTRFAP